jgi:hypothetical protein
MLQLAILTADSDIIGLLWKMPHTSTNAEYADMYVYDFCDESGIAAVEECRRRFPVHRMPDRTVFSKIRFRVSV